ncbi:MAG: hypothetical protein JWR69_1533, partial [Pedosphaera sp.]|nr:hypothetical protein [Pedosphaera sp.]
FIYTSTQLPIYPALPVVNRLINLTARGLESPRALVITPPQSGVTHQHFSDHGIRSLKKRPESCAFTGIEFENDPVLSRRPVVFVVQAESGSAAFVVVSQV